MNLRSFGKLGESAAAEYLKSKGYNIVGMNVYVGRCEIDILAENGEFLLFVEVKTRTQIPDVTSPFGRPATAVNAAKRKNMWSSARRYLYENKAKTAELQPRIDIIEVYADPKSESFKVLDIKHFPNAVHG